MTEADSATLTLLSVREDRGPFEYLGRQFKCNKVPWLGRVVASPVAVYFLKSGRSNQGYGGGLVGAMLSAALGKDDGLSTCNANDLPEAIRKELDPKGKLGMKYVVIVPKATVSLVKGGGLNNVIMVESGGDKFSVDTNLFYMFARPRAMVKMGWLLNRRVEPVAAPVHDMRSAAERADPGKPLWLKVLLIIGAIGILVAVVALRIAADSH